MFVALGWQRSVGGRRVTRGRRKGGERSSKRGFLAAAEKADAAALFVARAVQVCREPWQKNAKKTGQVRCPPCHVADNPSKHRCAGNVVPCEVRLPEQMLPGACDWGTRQAAFPPWSWDAVVSASVRASLVPSFPRHSPVLGFPSAWASPGRIRRGKLGSSRRPLSGRGRPGPQPPRVLSHVSVRRVLGSGSDRT